jgi:anti-sigma factor RsiW
MSCNRIETKILSYLDGRLKASEARDVETHLETCAACRLRVNEFRAVSGLLDELPQIGPSPAFDARVRARVAAEPVKQSWWAWFAPSPRVAFAASMLLLAMVWIGSRQSSSDPMVPVDQAQIESDMPVLENYDVLSNFEALTDLPNPVQNQNGNDEDSQQDTNQQM